MVMPAPTYNYLGFDSELFQLPVASIHLKKPEQLALLTNPIEANMPALIYLFSCVLLPVTAIENATGYFVNYHEEKVVAQFEIFFL